MHKSQPLRSSHFIILFTHSHTPPPTATKVIKRTKALKNYNEILIELKAGSIPYKRLNKITISEYIYIIKEEMD